MNSKTLSNFHKFGKVGKIAMTVLMVIAILATAASCVATIYVATLPKDALTVRVTNNAEFRINEKNFDSLWGILVDVNHRHHGIGVVLEVLGCHEVGEHGPVGQSEAERLVLAGTYVDGLGYCHVAQSLYAHLV